MAGLLTSLSCELKGCCSNPRTVSELFTSPHQNIVQSYSKLAHAWNKFSPKQKAIANFRLKKWVDFVDW